MSEIAHAFLDEVWNVSEIVGAQATMLELVVFTNTPALRISGSYRGLQIVPRFVGELLVEQPSLPA